jgi:hypothetical protein
LELVVAFVDFLLALLVVRRSWLRNIFECSPELVALIGRVIVVQMPRALLFEQVSEAVGGLLGVVLRRAMYSHDCVVWLALVVRNKAVVIATPLVLVITGRWGAPLRAGPKKMLRWPIKWTSSC